MPSKFNTEIDVPYFKQYFASENDMNCEQRQFYAQWLDNWKSGNPISVRGNISYLFCYVYKVLALPAEKAVAELTHLVDAYPEDTQFQDLCFVWISDCYVLMRNYHKAFELYPLIQINSRSASNTDGILSLKLQLNEHISGKDVLTLNGPKVTKWAKQHLDKISLYLDTIIAAYEKHNNLNLLEKWKPASHQYPYYIFTGTDLLTEADIPCFSFSRNDDVIKFITEKTHDAENSVRDEMDIPRIGEGWISETEFYYELRNALPDTEVIHHARPEWLGRQHLDVFIPKYNVAVEFQGLQHDVPVEYFGGEKGFKATKRRDAKKRRACTVNGVRLIYVRPGYVLQQVVNEIIQ